MLSFHYDPCKEGVPLRFSVGKPDLQSLHRSLGSRIRYLMFTGVVLAPGFFPALETCFPQLSSLLLQHVEPDGQSLASRIMLFCERMTRPMTISVREHVYE
jgi:hypothetical protein